MNLLEVSREIDRRLTDLFLADPTGRRPCHGADRLYAEDPNWRDLILFYEYFDGDNGRGVGASHQTGWTSLIRRSIEDLAKARVEEADRAARGHENARESMRLDPSDASRSPRGRPRQE